MEKMTKEEEMMLDYLYTLEEIDFLDKTLPSKMILTASGVVISRTGKLELE